MHALSTIINSMTRLPHIWQRVEGSPIHALLGKIKQFDPQQEEWPQYVERLEQFFKANNLTGDDKAAKHRATGPEPYKLLRSLLAPTKPKEKMYAKLVAKLTEHYSPTPSEVMQRFCFNSRSRKAVESVAAMLRSCVA